MSWAISTLLTLLIYWERCTLDEWFLLNTNVKSWSPFQYRNLWINCSAPLRRWRHSVIYGSKQNLSIRKTAKIYVRNFQFINGLRPTMTHIKQQKYFWHSTSKGHLVLLLICAIRQWPYIRIPAWTDNYCANIRSIQYPGIANFLRGTLASLS